jgi:hypothetical protein
MAFVDWTFAHSGGGSSSGVLDTSEKEAGNSSYESILGPDDFTNYNTLTRNSFTCQQMQVILWRRHARTSTGGVSDPAYLYIRHPSYGDLQISTLSGTQTLSDWTKYRVSFWYDSGANTKFGRIEYYDTDHWVQVGSDTNFGTGVPDAAGIFLKNAKSYTGSTCNSLGWFDELEVYSVAV